MVSQLPIYEASKSKDFPHFLIVWCPYEDCVGTKNGRPFIVHGPSWLRPNRIWVERTQKSTLVIGRSCPYCFRTGRIPSRSDVG